MVSQDLAVSAHRPLIRMGYVAELDGLRAFAVCLVLAFHGGWGWMSGGYVGVSLFFTLSGFLVTGLLIDEFQQHHRIDTRRFLVRRMRRLLPASLACLAAVAVLGALGAFGSQPELGRDLTGAALQVANWVSLTGDTSYAEQVLGTRSPVDHFWSLSIEEQFYWIWPFAIGFALKRSALVSSVAIATVLGFVVAIWIAVAFGPDAAYWATPARAGEVLVGAALAVVVRRQPSRTPSATTGLGLIGLGIVLWAAVTWPSTGGPAYHGALPFLAIASALVIHAALVGERSSMLRTALRLPPVVGVGKISYGVYLYHWPVFLLVDEALGRQSYATASRFALQVAITIGIALVSYRWLERPIRNGLGRTRPVAATCVAVTVLILAFATVASFGPADRFADPSAAASQLASVDAIEPLVPLAAPASTASVEPVAPTKSTAPTESTEPIESTESEVVGTTKDQAAPAVTDVAEQAILPDAVLAAVPPRPVRVVVFGDSTAWALGDGLAEWAASNPSLAQVDLAVVPGCGLITDGVVPGGEQHGLTNELVVACNELHGRLDRVIERALPDVVIVMATVNDMVDRTWVESEGRLSIFDATFHERAVRRYADFGRAMRDAGAATLWVKAPAPVTGSEQLLDPLRTEALHGIIDDAVDALGGQRTESVDLAAWYATSGIDDRVGRADGLHLERDAAVEISQRLIGPSLVNLALNTGG